MKCEYCEMLERQNNVDILYEDADVVIAVKDFSCIAGQITVFPKQHYTILEMVPDDIVQKCFILANKVSMAIFEGLGAQGTNILIQNGLGAGQKVPHFSIEVIPRREGDGLKLMWDTKQLSPDEMDTAYLLIKDEADKLVDLGKKKEKKEEPKAEAKKEDVAKMTKADGKDNYLLKSVRRLP